MYLYPFKCDLATRSSQLMSNLLGYHGISTYKCPHACIATEQLDDATLLVATEQLDVRLGASGGHGIPRAAAGRHHQPLPLLAAGPTLSLILGPPCPRRASLSILSIRRRLVARGQWAVGCCRPEVLLRRIRRPTAPWHMVHSLFKLVLLYFTHGDGKR